MQSIPKQFSPPSCTLKDPVPQNVIKRNRTNNNNQIKVEFSGGWNRVLGRGAVRKLSFRKRHIPPEESSQDITSHWPYFWNSSLQTVL